MSPEAQIFRAVVIRAVTGTRPPAIFTVHDATALEDLCEQLARAENAGAVLRRKGHGRAGMLLDEVAASVPMKGE